MAAPTSNTPAASSTPQIAQACFAAPKVAVCIVNGKPVQMVPNPAANQRLNEQIAQLAEIHRKQAEANNKQN